MRCAVFAGINHYDHERWCPRLRGCFNDIADMSAYLRGAVGLDRAVMLKDDEATAEALLGALREAATSLRSGDQLYFHYSGHGCRIPFEGRSHDAICPFDFDWSRERAILDLDLAAAFAGVPDGARVVVITDSCYSGGLVGDYALLANAAAAPPHLVRTIPVPPEIAAELARIDGDATKTMSLTASVAALNVVLVSGCSPRQESADAEFDGRPNGALTYYLLRQLQAPGGGAATAAATVTAVDDALHQARYSQTPELHGRRRFFDEPLIR